MSQQVRAAVLLRRAAEILDIQCPVAPTTTSCNPTSTTTATTTSCNMAQISAAARGLFGPYRNSRPFQRTSRRGGRVEPAVSYWTHKFSVVPRCNQETVPSREEKFKLHSAGLGEKRLTFVKNSNKSDFDRTLEEAFPKLKDCGGYELLRTPPGSRITLESIRIPTGGFTSAFLADESNLGQAVCYIRPIQKDLDMGILSAKAGGVKDTRQNYVGENARGGTLDVSCPIEHGVVTNWENMEYIWNYIFNEALKASAKDRNVLLTEPVLNPKINREKMVQIMFETFKTSGVYVVKQSLLALYASGRTEGIVLDSGYGLTQVVPVLQNVDGYVVRNAVVTSNLAGHNLSLYMAELLSQKGGFSFNPNAMTADADTLKKMSCYVAQNYDQELRQVAEKSYDLPQGEIIKSIKLGSERIKCPEGLFKPCLMGVDGSGVHEKLYHSISKCDRTTHKTLYANIVLSGGSTMFPGFEDRILKEVKALVAPDTDVKIIAPPNRNQTNWLGGSILGSLSTFGQMWITKKEYDENGPTIVHRKCF